MTENMYEWGRDAVIISICIVSEINDMTGALIMHTSHEFVRSLEIFFCGSVQNGQQSTYFQ